MFSKIVSFIWLALGALVGIGLFIVISIGLIRGIIDFLKEDEDD